MPPKKKNKPAVAVDEPEQPTKEKRNTTRARARAPIVQRPLDPETPNRGNNRATHTPAKTRRAPSKRLACNVSIAQSKARTLDTPPRAVDSLRTEGNGGAINLLSPSPGAGALNSDNEVDHDDDGVVDDTCKLPSKIHDDDDGVVDDTCKLPSKIYVKGGGETTRGVGEKTMTNMMKTMMTTRTES